MATEYRNPDMSLEFAVAALGINRTKINELLKDELGMTFGTYLNKLRLAEAARLLSLDDGANVAEIASLVGYINASYFNKLFKAEYGCTPGTFIGIYGAGKTE
jgi:AraC-like DNA-binding protein